MQKNNKNKKIKNINEYKKEKKNKHRNRVRLKLRKKLGAVFIFISIFGVIIGNICGYAVVSQLKYDIHYLKKELRKEEIILGELNAKFDTSTSIKQIEQKAKEELNMDYPTKNQIRYIKVKE